MICLLFLPVERLLSFKVVLITQTNLHFPIKLCFNSIFDDKKDVETS